MSTMGFIKHVQTNKQTTPTLVVPMEYTHACAIGQTGCGKTTSFIYPNLDNRLKSGHSILLYDYKGKEHLCVKHFAMKHKRLDDVIEVGKAWGSSINIIKYMNKKSLEKLFMDLYGHSKDNYFWSISSTNICVAVLDILKSTQLLYSNCKRITEVVDVDRYLFKTKGYEYEVEYTLRSLLGIVKSQDTLISFIKGMSKISDIFESLIQLIGENNETVEKADFIELFYEIEVLEEKIENAKKLFANIVNEKGQKNSSSTVESLIVCINAPLMSIASIPCLNHDELDMIESLDSGKVVVVDSHSFSDTVLSAFNNSIFTELSKRSKKNKSNPVSIFIDEAQKVFSKSFEMPIDVLRECKVEVFLAFQNKELMVEVLGENKFTSLYKNIKRRFLFKNPERFEEYDLSLLDTFEYYDDEIKDVKVYKGKNIFVKPQELFKPELQFQKKLQLDKKYIFSEEIKNMVLVYDEHLIEDNQVILLNRKGEQRVIKVYQHKYYQKVEEKYKEKIKSRIIEVDPFDFYFEPDDEWHEADDFDEICEFLELETDEQFAS